MTSEQVTILIPDISGYTQFVSQTEVSHGTHLLNHLLETIVKSTNEDFIVSEIEGDAVLLYKKGNPPSKKEIVKQCENIFNSFHTQLRGIDSIRICQCVACLGVTNLTLKFVVHYGTISENRVSNFVKASGLDMVIAHRLLKNNIDHQEYLLMSKNFLDNVPDAEDAVDLAWQPAQENYSSIGTIEFHYAPLDPFRATIPNIPKMGRDVTLDASPPIETEMNADYKNVFNTLIDLAARKDFIYGLKDIEFHIPVAVMGMKFSYAFEDLKIEAEPITIKAEENTINYAEYHRSEEKNLAYVLHFTLSHAGENKCHYSVHICSAPGATLSEEQRRMVTTMQEKSMKKLTELVQQNI